MLRWKSSLKPAAAAPPPTGITLEDSAVTTAIDFSSPVNVDVNIPAVSANDILLLFCATNDYSEPTSSPPAGWTKIAEKDGASTNISTVAAYWKRASSSASATTETWSSFFAQSEAYYVWVGAYSGCVTSGSPVDAYGSSTVAFGSTWSVNVTTTTADTMIVTISGNTDPTLTHTWSDGTELIDTSYFSANASVSINEKLESTTGSKTRTVTPSASGGNAMIAVALRSADSYLIDENFDDNLLPSDWTFTSDGGNSYTVSGGLLYAANESDYVTFDVPAAMQDEFWVKALIDNVGGTPSKADWYSFIEVLDSSSVEFIRAQFWGQEPPYGSGTYRLDGATTVASLAQSIFFNSYYVWFHFVKNGTSELWVSQSSTRPTTDSTSECVISCSTDNTSADKIKLRLGYGNGTRPIYWDFFIGDENDPEAGDIILEERFEESDSGGALGSSTDGYDSSLVSSEVTTTGSTIDPDESTTSVLSGSQSLEIDSASGDNYVEFDLGSDYDELWFHVEVNRIYSGVSNRSILKFFNQSGTLAASLGGNTNSRPTLLGASAASAFTYANPSAVDHFWLHWVRNSTSTFYFAQNSSTRPTSGGDVVSFTAADVAIGKFQIGSFNLSGNYRYDDIIVSTSEIGNDP